MPKLHEFTDSKFLKKEDVGPGALVKLMAVKQHNVAVQGAEPDLKWCAHFDKFEKPMVINSTNAQLMAAIAGSDDSDHWIGKYFVLYNDPNVTFAGKVTGGLRVRAPKAGSIPIVDRSGTTKSFVPTEDDLPF